MSKPTLITAIAHTPPVPDTVFAVNASIITACGAKFRPVILLRKKKEHITEP